jgi:hypothetical protein
MVPVLPQSPATQDNQGLNRPFSSPVDSSVARVHQFRKETVPDCGANPWRLSCCRNSQTRTVFWSMISSSWSHRGHFSRWSSPRRASWSAVQHFLWGTNHTTTFSRYLGLSDFLKMLKLNRPQEETLIRLLIKDISSCVHPWKMCLLWSIVFLLLTKSLWPLY